MNQRAPKYKTTRLFSAHLADHDTYFAPKQKRPRRFRWLAMIKYTPAFICFIFPSFHLGTAVFRDPGVKIPEVLTKGEVFTLPGDDDDLLPVLNGRKMAFIDGKKPVYLAVASKGPSLEISYDFTEVDERGRLKGLIPRPKHPTYPLYAKKVRVLEESLTQLASVDAPPAPLFEERPAPPYSEDEQKALDRKDGKVKLRCWKEPHVEPLPIDLIKRRRRMGAIQSAGQGEVIAISPTDGPQGVTEYSVLVNHGGGLFTRYWAIRELRIRKGSKLSIGQVIGNVALALPVMTRKGKEELQTPTTWAPIMGGGSGLAPAVIKAQSLLGVSSQLCDSK